MKHRTTQYAHDLLLQGQIAFAQMEAQGIRVDHGRLKQTFKDVDKQISVIERQMSGAKTAKVWRNTYGEKTNFDSRQQLAEVLFNKIGYTSAGVTEKSEGLEKDKQRQRTDKAALEVIEDDFVQNFLRVQTLKKTRSTFLQGIERAMVQRDGHWYVHPNFNLNLVQSFRSSSDGPNFQNNPVRNPEIGEMVRRLYIPLEGWHFGEVDYSQMEVRIAACYNHDPELIRYIKDKTTDMHRDMACSLYFLKPNQVTKEVRHTAKNMFVFPQFYGSVYYQCAPELWEAIIRRKLQLTDGTDLLKHLRKNKIEILGDCDPEYEPVKGTFEWHVQKVEQRMWKKFRVYTQWKRDYVEQYRREGGLTTFTGFAVTGQHKKNDILNYAVQCDGFIPMLWSIIQLTKRLRKYKMKSQIIGEIHDSLQANVHPKEVDSFLNLCHDVMVDEVKKEWDWITVPLETESEISDVNESWFNKQQWIPNDKGDWAPKRKAA